VPGTSVANLQDCAGRLAAVALAASFLLPSTLEVAIKVSELFMQLNTTDTHHR